MQKRKTAHYNVIVDSGGNRYKFFCDLIGARFSTTRVYNEAYLDTELELAWETEGKKNFQLCQKCGKWVIDAMYNADALECVACAPWENTPPNTVSSAEQKYPPLTVYVRNAKSI